MLFDLIVCIVFLYLIISSYSRTNKLRAENEQIKHDIDALSNQIIALQDRYYMLLAQNHHCESEHE